MKLKELITKLRSFEEEHGDRDVKILASAEGFADPTDVEFEDDDLLFGKCVLIHCL